MLNPTLKRRRNYLSLMLKIIYWTEKGLPLRNKICEYFKIPMNITVNGETQADIDKTMLDKLEKTQRRGFIQIRNKKWKI